MNSENAIDDIFKQQKAWFYAGKTRDLAVRLAALRKLKEVIFQHRQHIYTALKSDLGKTPEIVDRVEIGAVVEEIDSALEGLAQWARDDVFMLSGTLAGSEGRICREPFGVCYVIGPFNYPFNLTLTPLVGAIAAGNTAILKPSEATPETSKIIIKIIYLSFPPAYVAVVEG